MKPIFVFESGLPLVGYEAITIYPFIFMRDSKVNYIYTFWGNEYLKHELCHFYQQRDAYVIPFFVSYIAQYLWGLLKYRNHDLAYLNISYEIEARFAELEDLTSQEWDYIA